MKQLYLFLAGLLVGSIGAYAVLLSLWDADLWWFTTQSVREWWKGSFWWADSIETICDDGIDNDGDGYVDCDDSNCAGIGSCGIGTGTYCTDTDGNWIYDSCARGWWWINCDTIYDCPPFNSAECGNGLLEQGEQCDDGWTQNGDGCDEFCQFEEFSCDNLLSIQSLVSVEYIPGTNGGTFVLSPWSYVLECNPNQYIPNPQQVYITEPFQVLWNPTTYTFDAWSYKVWCEFTGCLFDVIVNSWGTWWTGWNAICGNGVLESGEACDDGGLQNGDGCDEFCQLEEVWCENDYSALDYNGDGVVDVQDSDYLKQYVLKLLSDDPASCDGTYFPNAKLCCKQWQICDLNCDGQISTQDVVAVSQIVNGSQTPDLLGDEIDNNCDGSVDCGENPSTLYCALPAC